MGIPSLVILLYSYQDRIYINHNNPLHIYVIPSLTGVYKHNILLITIFLGAQSYYCTTRNVGIYSLQVAQFVAGGSVGCLGLSNAMSDMHVEAPPGNTIGGVHQDYLFAFQQWFSVVNAEGQTQLKITKSMGNFFSPEVDFKVYIA